MPLRGSKQNIWHWTQAVAWIGFDILDAVEGNYLNWGLPSLGLPGVVESKAKPAIRELVYAVCNGELEMIVPPGSIDPQKLSAEEQAKMCAHLGYGISPTPHYYYSGEVKPRYLVNFYSSRYLRGDVLRIWPDEDENGQKRVRMFQWDKIKNHYCELLAADKNINDNAAAETLIAWCRTEDMIAPSNSRIRTLIRKEKWAEE